MTRVIPVIGAALALALVVDLGGCGKKGAPHAPGPADKITYPAVYPPE